MPRRPDDPCSRCGRLLWRGTGAMPPGRRVCRECRKIEPARRGPLPEQSLRCKTCDASFVGIPPAKYCRPQCRPSNKVRARPCAVCGRSCVRPSAVPICSDECRRRRRRETYRVKNYKRRTLALPSDITPAYERDLRATAKRCPMPGCGVRMTDVPFLSNSKELDHIVPINAGGTHTIGNVRIICRQCNQQRPKDGSDYTGPVTLWAAA